MELDSIVQDKENTHRKSKVSEFIIYKTLLKVSNQFVWVWIAIDASSKTILGIRISFERTMLVAEQFLNF